MSPISDSISDAARAAAPISGATIAGVSAMYITLCTVSVASRMSTRFIVHQQFWWDDWAMLIAWAATVVLCSLLILTVKYGAGLNIWDVPEADYKQFVKIFLDEEMMARTGIFFAKLSILLMYIRIFFPKGTRRTGLWWVIQSVLWLNFLYTLSLILDIALQCVPYGLPFGDSCENQYGLFLSASVINIISDIAVLIIPMGSLWRLQMSRKQKWAIWALFAFGTLAPVSSIARLAYQVPIADGTNKTVIYPIVIILATAEQTISVIAGCIPVTSAWVRLFLGMRLRKRTPKSGSNRTLTQRFWPDRESGPKTESRDKRSGGSDPYPITRATMTGLDSEEVLHPHESVDNEWGTLNNESWPLEDNSRRPSPE